MSVRVLVVDDSAFARKVLRESLSISPQIEVIGIARDGIDALEKIAELQPDVITLDLVMPNLDGLGVLAALTPEQRRRVVLVSMADGQSDIGIAALALGAFDLVHKPTALALDSLYDIGRELVAKVLLAAEPRPPLGAPPPPIVLARADAAGVSRQLDRVIVVGTSTGGPQALTQLLAALPADLPAPVVIVLHIPPGYTAPLAARLNQASPLDVVEASQGLILRPGLVVLAMAGLHLRVHGTAERASLELDPDPYDSLHRPSVDILFESAARVFGARTLGIVLTGMGDDGLIGARAISAAGGQVLTEAEATCVVYGMPRVIKEAGFSTAEHPLYDLPAAIIARLS